MSERDKAATGHPSRRVRSFVRRDGRVTEAQRRALAEGTEWLLPAGEPLAPLSLFGRRAPLVVEVGCGNGDNLIAQAAARPDTDFIGIEPYTAGVGNLVRRVADAGVTNLRVLPDDAVPVLERWLPRGSIDELWIFFPDPWPKKKHHKRRLVQPAFLLTALAALRSHGLIRIGTDWEPYAEHIVETIEATPAVRWLNRASPALRPAWRPITRFEGKGLAKGHVVNDFVLMRA